MDTSGLIIGGGPAGLSLACALKYREVPSLVLEKGPLLGNTFRTMAANTTYGPWINDRLPHSSVNWFDLLRRATREQYAQYLSDYAISHDLDHRTGVTVEAVRREGNGFAVDTDQGTFTSRFVVNATGYFSGPNIPTYRGADTTNIPQIHASAYKEPATVRNLLGSNRGRILIVGKKLSAGEAMESLHKAGYEVAISHRSPIEFGASSFMEACLSPFTCIWEEFQVRVPGAPRPWNLDVRMNGGYQRELIESGAIKLYPDIDHFEADTVMFADGREERFDLVIYATGYKPALKHLEGLIDLSTGRPRLNGFESQEVPGLYFLGLIGLRTFRSQFLRGISEDSRRLGLELAYRYSHRSPVPLA